VVGAILAGITAADIAPFHDTGGAVRDITTAATVALVRSRRFGRGIWW
jgi:hypothetical protein